MQLQHVLESMSDITVFERRTECLRDLLLEDRTALSKKEMSDIRDIFNQSQQLSEKEQGEIQLVLLSLASMLEPLIENNNYAHEIASVVRILLKSSVKTLRYAGIEIIAAGLNISPIADKLLEEAKILLKNEESGYVLDYFESL